MAALLLFSLWPRAGQNLGLTPASGSRQALARSPAGSAVTQVLAWAAASCRVPWCRLQRRICSPCQEEGQQQCHPAGEPRVAPRGAGAVCRHRASGEDPVPSLDPPRQPRLLATGVPSPRAPLRTSEASGVAPALPTCCRPTRRAFSVGTGFQEGPSPYLCCLSFCYKNGFTCCVIENKEQKNQSRPATVSVSYKVHIFKALITGS